MDREKMVEKGRYKGLQEGSSTRSSLRKHSLSSSSSQSTIVENTGRKGQQYSVAQQDSIRSNQRDNATLQRTLKEGALYEVENLRKQLVEAKKELKGLKSDNLVLAGTRTIKRLLD